jgi:hypothetical protein
MKLCSIQYIEKNKLKNPPVNYLAENKAWVQGLCNTMRNQLISRAFYGWLSHCRNMRTVRSHLQGELIERKA